MSDQSRFGADDLAHLARRAVDAVTTLVRRALALAGGVLIVALFCCVGGFLLGIAAFSGGSRSVWIVVGGFFLLLGVGSVVVAMWRLWAVRRSTAALIAEVRDLIAGDRRSERVVIETVETSEESSDVSAVVLSRQFFDLRNTVAGHHQTFSEITAALRAITTFPFLIALATAISVVFAGLGLLFLIALAV